MNALVYTEVQIAIPFHETPWQSINDALAEQEGILNKTWLAGVDASSVGGFYAFDSIENAQAFVTGYFPQEAKALGRAQRTLIFNARMTEQASKEMNSVHFGGTLRQPPGAFVYTEVQVNVESFHEKSPWRELNPILRAQPGLLSKTWLSGLNTGTVGGFYAFDTLDHAKRFALDYFPTEAAELNAAFTTRLFDARATEQASRAMNSPFYQ